MENFVHTFGARLASKLARNPGQASIARLKLFLEVHCWLQLCHSSQSDGGPP